MKSKAKKRRKYDSKILFHVKRPTQKHYFVTHYWIKYFTISSFVVCRCSFSFSLILFYFFFLPHFFVYVRLTTFFEVCFFVVVVASSLHFFPTDMHNSCDRQLAMQFPIHFKRNNIMNMIKRIFFSLFLFNFSSFGSDKCFKLCSRKPVDVN